MRINVNIKIKLNQILKDEIKKNQSKYKSIKSLRTRFDLIHK